MNEVPFTTEILSINHDHVDNQDIVIRWGVPRLLIIQMKQISFDSFNSNSVYWYI